MALRETIRKRLAGVLLKDDIRGLHRAQGAVLEAYRRGPAMFSPSDFAETLRELDSHQLSNIIRELDYMRLNYGEPGEADRQRLVLESRYLYRTSVTVQYSIFIWGAYGYGENVDVVPAEEDAKVVWDEFWKADRNLAVLGDRNLASLSDILLRDGEEFLALFVSLIDGQVTLRLVDTMEITERITAPLDSETPLFYKREWTDEKLGPQVMYYPDMLTFLSSLEDNSPGQRLGEAENGKDLFAWTGKNEKGEDVGPSDLLPERAIRADQYQAQTFVCLLPVVFNKKSGWRGWPLMSVGFPWIKEYEQFRVNRANVAEAASMFFRDITVQGGSRAVKTAQSFFESTYASGQLEEKNPVPTAGSSFIHNAATDMKNVSQLTGAADAKEDGQALFHYALLSGGIFPHYAGVGDSYRLATACYSEDTEVLTEQGWLDLEQWRELQPKIAQYDPTTRQLSYVFPKVLHIYPYNGELLRVGGRRTEALVTPNHRMLALNENNDKTEWQVTEAQNLQSRFALPTTAGLADPGLEESRFLLDWPAKSTSPQRGPRWLDMDAWLEFLGWWAAEGSIHRGSCRGAYRIELSLGPTDPDLGELLARLPFKFHRRTGRPDQQRWRCGTDAVLYKWLEAHCGKGAGNKRVPEFVYSLSARQKRLYFEAVWAGDGHKGESSGFLTSTSRELLNGVQRLLLECGEWAYLSIQRPLGRHRNPNARECYVLYRQEKLDAHHLTRDRHVESQAYVGLVWCFETDTGFFLTRRYGKPMIAGNTQMEGPMLHQFQRYQKFWSSIWRDISRFVLTVAELFGQGTFDDKSVQVSLDKVIQTDFDQLATTLGGIYRDMLVPLMAAGAIPEPIAQTLIVRTWQLVLQAMGVQDVDEVLSEETFKKLAEEEAAEKEKAEAEAAKLAAENPQLVPPGNGEPPPGPPPAGNGNGREPAAVAEEWNEDSHPRDADGKFASGGVGLATSARIGLSSSLRGGGFTYSVVNRASPTNGFMVSPFKEREMVIPLSSFTDRDLSIYVDKNSDVLREKDSYLGGWLNNEDGNVYLDVSIRRESLDGALALAREHGQLAIFDLGKMEEIATEGGVGAAREHAYTRTPGKSNLASVQNLDAGHLQTADREGMGDATDRRGVAGPSGALLGKTPTSAVDAFLSGLGSGKLKLAELAALVEASERIIARG